MHLKLSILLRIPYYPSTSEEKIINFLLPSLPVPTRLPPAQQFRTLTPLIPRHLRRALLFESPLMQLSHQLLLLLLPCRLPNGSNPKTTLIQLPSPRCCLLSAYINSKMPHTPSAHETTLYIVATYCCALPLHLVYTATGLPSAVE